MANELRETKLHRVIDPAAIVDNDDFESRVIDRAELGGADYLEFQGYIGATDIALAELKVVESDTKTDATTLGGTPSDVIEADTKPGADDDNKFFVFGLDLRKSRKQFLQLQATAGSGAAGTFLTAWAVARRPGEASARAADRGALFAHYD